MVRSVPAIPFNPGPKSVLVKVTIAVMKYHDQSNLMCGGGGFILLVVPYNSSPSKAVHYQGQDLGAGAEAEAMEGYCLLACSSWFAQPAFLQNKGPPAQE